MNMPNLRYDPLIDELRNQKPDFYECRRCGRTFTQQEWQEQGGCPYCTEGD